jgi:hypothetical protein
MARWYPLVRPERGPLLRAILAVLFLVLGIYLALITVDGLRTGILQFPGRNPHIDVYRELRPGTFWSIAVFWVAVSIWILSMSIAELTNAFRVWTGKDIVPKLDLESIDPELLKSEPPSGSRLLDIVSEVGRKGYRTRAYVRAAQRKSPWNALIFALAGVAYALTGYALARFAWALRNFVLSTHPVTFMEMIRRANDSGPICLLFFIPPLFACIPIALFVGNFLVYLIPPARRSLDREAVGIWHGSYAEAQKDLALFMLWISLPGLVLSVVGAFLLRIGG